jgi:hypothetical protein
VRVRVRLRLRVRVRSPGYSFPDDFNGLGFRGCI